MNYSELALKHFYSPRHVGILDRHDPHVLTGSAGGLNSGDTVRLQLYVNADQITEAKFKAQGNVGTIASASWLTEWLIGKSLSEARAITAEIIAAELALPRDRLYCTKLAETALKVCFRRI